MKPLDERIVDSGHYIQFEKKFYRMLDSHWMLSHYRSGTKVMGIETFDWNLFCCVDNKDIYVLEAIPARAAKSKNLDAD